MNLHRLFRRDPDLPPLSEEDWAPIAAALRELPDIPAPRDFRLTIAQAARLRPRPLRERLALPAPLATGIAAVLVVAVLAPSLLSSLGTGGAASSPAAGELFAPADRNAAGASDNAGSGLQVPVVGPKAFDACASPTPMPSASPPIPTPSPTPVEASVEASAAPAPVCDP